MREPFVPYNTRKRKGGLRRSNPVSPHLAERKVKFPWSKSKECAVYIRRKNLSQTVTLQKNCMSRQNTKPVLMAGRGHLRSPAQLHADATIFGSGRKTTLAPYHESWIQMPSARSKNWLASAMKSKKPCRQADMLVHLLAGAMVQPLD